MKSHSTTSVVLLVVLASFVMVSMTFHRKHVRAEALEDWFPSGVPDWVDSSFVTVDDDGIWLPVSTVHCSYLEKLCTEKGWTERFTWKEGGFFERQPRILNVLRSNGVRMDEVKAIYVRSIDGSDVGYLILTQDVNGGRRSGVVCGLFVLHRS